MLTLTLTLTITLTLTLTLILFFPLFWIHPTDHPTYSTCHWGKAEWSRDSQIPAPGINAASDTASRRLSETVTSQAHTRPRCRTSAS